MNKFYPGQKIKFVAGTFKGKSGTVQMHFNDPGQSGRVLVKINGSGPDANGRQRRLGSTMADPSEITSAV